MSNFSDKLLRFMGYATVIILVLVVIIAVYIVYNLTTSSPFNNDEPNRTEDMEETLQEDLNSNNNQIDPNVIALPNSGTTNPDPNSQYQSPNAQIPSHSTYNPFEDNNIPVNSNPNTIDSTTSQSTSNGVEEIPLNIQPSEPDKSSGSSSSKPIDPTKKNPQGNLDQLF